MNPRFNPRRKIAPRSRRLGSHHRLLDDQVGQLLRTTDYLMTKLDNCSQRLRLVPLQAEGGARPATAPGDSWRFEGCASVMGATAVARPSLNFLAFY